MSRPPRSLLLVAPAVCVLAGCGSLGGGGDDPDLGPPPKLRGSGDRPVDHLPRTEFPFDENGNYVVAWAQEGDKKYRPISSASSSRTWSRRSSSSSRSSSSTSSSRRTTSSTRYHTVRSGDTLWAISRRYGKSVSSIKSANGLRSDTIRTGQRLKIP